MGIRQLKISQKITVRENKSLNIYLTDIARLGGPLTSEEENELTQLVKDGDKETSEKAAKKLIESNLRFVVSVAKQYQNLSSAISLEDLIDEGNLGLIKAVYRFDPTRGFKLISFAVWWIRQAIMEYLSENARKIRLPSNKVQAINRLKNAEGYLEQRLQRPPTLEEVVEYFKKEEKEGKASKEFSEKNIKELYISNQFVASLDSPVSNDEDASLLVDVTPIENDCHDVNVTLKNQDLKYKVDIMLKKLQPREREVLKGYFGLENKPQKSLEQIGEEMGLVPERIRQIRESALRKLKGANIRKFVAEFIS